MLNVGKYGRGSGLRPGLFGPDAMGKEHLACVLSPDSLNAQNDLLTRIGREGGVQVIRHCGSPGLEEMMTPPPKTKYDFKPPQYGSHDSQRRDGVGGNSQESRGPRRVQFEGSSSLSSCASQPENDPKYVKAQQEYEQSKTIQLSHTLGKSKFSLQVFGGYPKKKRCIAQDLNDSSDSEDGGEESLEEHVLNEEDLPDPNALFEAISVNESPRRRQQMAAYIAQTLHARRQNSEDNNTIANEKQTEFARRQDNDDTVRDAKSAGVDGKTNILSSDKSVSAKDAGIRAGDGESEEHNVEHPTKKPKTE